VEVEGSARAHCFITGYFCQPDEQASVTLHPRRRLIKTCPSRDEKIIFIFFVSRPALKDSSRIPQARRLSCTRSEKPLS
jgi:hypothetical protein